MKILNCPFCGSPPGGLFRRTYSVTSVNCSNRNCIAFFGQVSIEKWNTRVDSKASVSAEDPYKEKYENLLAFVEKARQESTLVTYQDERGYYSKIQVPYWFMKNPE